MVVKRTPGISTTDLVGRILLCTKKHHIRSLQNALAGREGSGNVEERKQTGEEMMQRIRDYATNETGLQPGPIVLRWDGSKAVVKSDAIADSSKFTMMVQGVGPKQGQRIVYVDGGFDLFSSGHIEFLRQVILAEEAIAQEHGWYAEAAVKRRISQLGNDYGPTYIVAGVHDDATINYWKGINYPIMNTFERGLCVLQCRVSRLLER